MADRRVVMLVEDHAQLRSILARVLAQTGFDVTAVGDAEQAVAEFERGNVPHVLLSDVRMPGRWSGVELANWVHQNHPMVQILLQTGYAHIPTGPFRVLQKPFSHEELVAALQSLG